MRLPRRHEAGNHQVFRNAETPCKNHQRNQNPASPYEHLNDRRQQQDAQDFRPI